MPYCTEVKRRTFVPLQVDPLRTRPFGGKTGRTQGSTEPLVQPSFRKRRSISSIVGQFSTFSNVSNSSYGSMAMRVDENH